MNRLVRGSVMLAALVIVSACGGDPTANGADATARLSADPAVLFLDNGATQEVIVEALNGLGQQLAGDFEAANIGAGIVVVKDTTFGVIIGQGPNPTRARFEVSPVSPTTFVSTTFDVTANGKTVTIPVKIVPASFVISFSNPSPAPGQVVTLTAPAGVVFTSATTVIVTGGAQVVGISADSTQISVIFATGALASTATVTNVAVSYLPGQLFNVQVTTPVTTDSLSNFVPTVSTLTPAVGGAVTVTLPAPFKATSATTVSIAGGAGAVISIAADSSSFVFLVGPNANGPVVVNNVQISGAPGLGQFTLTAAGILVSPPLTAFTGSFSTSTPDVNQNVTLTATGFKFRPGSKIFFGNDQQHVVSISADSNTLTFRAGRPGASGTISVNGIALNFLPGVGLLLNATTAVTVTSTVLTLPGADQLATAAGVTIPDVGKTFTLVDNGTWFAGPAFCTTSLGGPCRLYTFVLTTARSYSVSATWQGTTDVGVYFINAAQAAVGTTGCDAKGAGAAGQPETCTVTALPGASTGTTYYIVVDDFSPFYGPPNNVPPTGFTVVLTGL